MIDLKEIEKMIIDFGLSTREAKVYTVLFNKKDFTASEIQQLVNIPRTKVYEVLYLLISKGLCAERKIGRLKKYEAVNPKYAFDKLIVEYEEELAVKEKMKNQILKIFSPLYEKRKGNDDPLEYIEIVKNREQVGKKWLNILNNATKEILVFIKPPYAISTDEKMEEERKLFKRKVKFKSIFEYISFTPETEEVEFKMISDFISSGREVRIVKELPMKLAIIDEKITMLSLNDPISLQPSITTMIINHPNYAKAHKCIFENIWQEAMTFEEFKIKKKSLIKDV